MYNWFKPQIEDADISTDIKLWKCVHPFVNSFKIKQEVTVNGYYEVDLKMLNGASHTFMGKTVDDCIHSSEEYLNNVFPFEGVKLKTIEGEIDLKTVNDSISIEFYNKGKKFNISYNTSRFINLLLRSKIFESHLNDLEEGIEMSFMDWIYYKICGIVPTVKYRKDETGTWKRIDGKYKRDRY